MQKRWSESSEAEKLEYLSTLLNNLGPEDEMDFNAEEILALDIEVKHPRTYDFS